MGVGFSKSLNIHCAWRGLALQKYISHNTLRRWLAPLLLFIRNNRDRKTDREREGDVVHFHSNSVVFNPLLYSSELSNYLPK